MILNQSFIKTVTFLSVGLGVAFFQYLSFYVLLEILRLHYIEASSLAYLLTVFSSYFAHKYITFRDLSRDSKKKTLTSLVLYFANAGFCFLVNASILAFGVGIFLLSPYLVQGISIVFLAIYNFFVYQVILR